MVELIGIVCFRSQCSRDQKHTTPINAVRCGGISLSRQATYFVRGLKFYFLHPVGQLVCKHVPPIRVDPVPARKAIEPIAPPSRFTLASMPTTVTTLRGTNPLWAFWKLNGCGASRGFLQGLDFLKGQRQEPM
jgi:hypothetical protein